MATSEHDVLFVDFNGTMQLADVLSGNMAIRNLAQGKYGIFIPIARQELCRAVAQLARTRCRQQNQFKAVFYVF
jgi:hypothetical protein